MSWNVLPAVRAWVAGRKPNHGLALGGLDSALKAADSRETGGDEIGPRGVAPGPCLPPRARLPCFPAGRSVVPPD